MANIVQSGSIKLMATQEQKLEIALARLEERVASMHEDMNEMKSQISSLSATANRWKGAFWVLMALGGVVGVLSNLVVDWIK